MSRLFSISSDYTVHGVHDINSLRIPSAQKARQRLDRAIQIQLYHDPEKVITLPFYWRELC
jgi:hypothetical protein